MRVCKACFCSSICVTIATGLGLAVGSLKFFILLLWRLGFKKTLSQFFPLCLAIFLFLLWVEFEKKTLKYNALGFLSTFPFSSWSQGCMFFCQTSIYRTAVKYLTLFPHPSDWRVQSCQIIRHPYGNNEQRCTSIFVPCVIRKYLCIIKDFVWFLCN